MSETAINKKRILVCDDDEYIREITSIVLEKNGFEFLMVNNGDQILEAIAEFKPDLVLMDVMMPGRNGKEITKELKSNPKTKDLPILLYSTSTNPEKICSESGADGYIEKPFEIKDFVEKVKRYSEKPVKGEMPL